MFTSFIWGLVTGLLIIIGIELLKIITNYIKNNGFDVWINLLFLMILLCFVTSCFAISATEEFEESPPILSKTSFGRQ